MLAFDVSHEAREVFVRVLAIIVSALERPVARVDRHMFKQIVQLPPQGTALQAFECQSLDLAFGLSMFVDLAERGKDVGTSWEVAMLLA